MQVGDISWPEHIGIFTIPVRAAVQFEVPLIIWGENSQNEYGGPAADSENNVLTRRWLEEFGGLLGLRVSDLIGLEGIEEKHLIPYTYPSDEDLKRVGVTGIFLGYYMPWDGYSNALVAQAHGFSTLQTTVEGSIVNYENLDNYQTGIHDYFKFLKFGYGRATDDASMEIRHGRMTREEGIEMVKQYDAAVPSTLQTYLDFLEISKDEFYAIVESMRDLQIWEIVNGEWRIKDSAVNHVHNEFTENARIKQVDDRAFSEKNRNLYYNEKCPPIRKGDQRVDEKKLRFKIL